MDKNRKLLLAGVLLILFAAAKLLLLDWWQKQQPQAHAAECDLIKIMCANFRVLCRHLVLFH